MGLYEALNRLSFFFRSYFYQLTRRRPIPSVSHKARARGVAFGRVKTNPQPSGHVPCTVVPTSKGDVAFRETDHVQNFCLAFCHQPTNLFPCKSPDTKLNPVSIPTPSSRVVFISFSLSPSSSSLHEWCLVFR